jgi:hypothetical protein
MNIPWQQLRDWLLEAEVITPEQAARLTEVAEAKMQAETASHGNFVRQNRAAYEARPWWRKLGGYDWKKDYRRMT